MVRGFGHDYWEDAEERVAAARMHQLDELPEFDLVYHLDETEQPAEVTIHPGGPENYTAWITADYGDAVALEDIA